MHDAAYQFVAAVAGKRPRGLVVEIGARDINGSVRPLFAPDPYLGVDVTAGRGVDVVADGATFEPVTPAACVVCCEVLEHTPIAGAIVRHARSMLMREGILIVTAAGVARAPHSARDGGALRLGEYYRGVAVIDLAAWLGDFHAVVIQETEDRCDVYAWATS